MKITVTTNNPKHQQLATFLREMFVDVSYKHPRPSWEKWFAWYPVRILQDRPSELVWMKTIYRRQHYDRDVNCNWYEYGTLFDVLKEDHER